jgi:protocatechuate 3,4-dioxygenase beta subunit
MPPESSNDEDRVVSTLSRRQILTSGVLAVGAVVTGASAGTAATTSLKKVTRKFTKAVLASKAANGCSVIPQETGGPFPGDGTNGPNVLTEPGVVRSDIRTSVGSASGVAGGVPLRVKLRLQSSKDCSALAGAAVYIWHCSREGAYSMYDAAAASENYLRGVQVADVDGDLEFLTAFPGAYSGRWPHIHVEVYPSAAKAISGNNTITVTQIALPETTCKAVYASKGYEASRRNLASSSLATDNEFGDDGGVHELAAMSGTIARDLTAALTITVDPTSTPGVAGGFDGGRGKGSKGGPPPRR